MISRTLDDYSPADGVITEIGALLATGLALIPIPRGEKGPRQKDWNQPRNSITRPEQARLLLNKNIGLAHAYCRPTPTCALDIDNGKLASRFLAKRGISIASLALAPDAVAIWSGKKGSLKLLYRLPEGTDPILTKVIKDEKGNVILELRCACKATKTVQDVLPPSIHPSGTQYQWLGNGDPRFIPTIQPALLALWIALLTETNNERPTRPTRPTNLYCSPETPREVATLISALQHLTADCDYETWRNIVWAILSTGWKSAQEIARRWSESAPDRFNEASFNTVVNSYREDHPKPITAGTIFFLARLRGWNV